MVVKLFATFREGRGKEVDVPWYEGINGTALLEALDLTSDDVKILLINGQYGKLEDTLKQEDVISLFPAVGGG